MTDRVRVVVAEGPSTRKGLLRFVLEGEGYDVVGAAETSAELARVVGAHRPNVVVMDDGIGAMAVSMIREIAPSTRVILVWPGAVVPIGGDARVEPSDVLRELGRTMERLTGQPSTTSAGDPLQGAGTGGPPRQDPAALREILARGEAAQLRRSRPGHEAVAVGDGTIDDRSPAPVVTLPVTASIEPSTEIGDAHRAGDDEIILVPEAEPLTSPTPATDPDPVSPRPAAGTLVLDPPVPGGSRESGAAVREEKPVVHVSHRHDHKR